MSNEENGRRERNIRLVFSDGNGMAMEMAIAIINHCLLYDSNETIAAITCFSFYI